MRNELFYFNSTLSDRNLINLCSGASAGETGSKLKFFLLPDRQMSFLKIMDFPSAPKNKLRDMVRFQMVKIYPGNTEDISFDFIPFKTETGWKIALYILKKKYLNEVHSNKKFEGIIFPLQLLSGKKLKSLSKLIIFYPDMVEIWKLVDGVPFGVERHDSRGFSVQDSLIDENEKLNPDKIITIYPDNKIPKWKMKNGRTKRFSEIPDFRPKNAIYFPEYRVTKRDRITTLIVITAFIISILLLSLTTLKYKEFIIKERELNAFIESVQLAADQNRVALKITSKLENELTQVKGDIPFNIYNLILSTSKAINPTTILLSFVFKSKELSLTLNSRSTLDDLEGLKLEFGNIRASSIRTLGDGSENFTVWVEVGQ